MIDAEQLPTLETERLRLRWLHERDVPELFEISSDPEVTRYWSTPPCTDPTPAAQLLADTPGIKNRRLVEGSFRRVADLSGSGRRLRFASERQSMITGDGCAPRLLSQ